jgi:hypothetical protein
VRKSSSVCVALHRADRAHLVDEAVRAAEFVPAVMLRRDICLAPQHMHAVRAVLPASLGLGFCTAPTRRRDAGSRAWQDEFARIEPVAGDVEPHTHETTRSRHTRQSTRIAQIGRNVDGIDLNSGLQSHEGLGTSW